MPEIEREWGWWFFSSQGSLGKLPVKYHNCTGCSLNLLKYEIHLILKYSASETIRSCISQLLVFLCFVKLVLTSLRIVSPCKGFVVASAWCWLANSVWAVKALRTINLYYYGDFVHSFKSPGLELKLGNCLGWKWMCQVSPLCLQLVISAWES